MPIPEVVSKLAQAQRQGGLTDSDFAKKLGVSRSTWGKTKHGKLALNWAITIATITLYPDLIWAALEAMRDDFHQSIKRSAA